MTNPKVTRQSRFRFLRLARIEVLARGFGALEAWATCQQSCLGPRKTSTGFVVFPCWGARGRLKLCSSLESVYFPIYWIGVPGTAQACRHHVFFRDLSPIISHQHACLPLGRAEEDEVECFHVRPAVLLRSDPNI